LRRNARARIGRAEQAHLLEDVRVGGLEIGFVPGPGGRARGGTIDAAGDHRIAMLGAVAGVSSREGVAIEGADTAAISFPGFYELLESVTRR
jgi:3-phosphoshikimate 1-carboxyvinyltransferase